MLLSRQPDPAGGTHQGETEGGRARRPRNAPRRGRAAARRPLTTSSSSRRCTSACLTRSTTATCSAPARKPSARRSATLSRGSSRSKTFPLNEAERRQPGRRPAGRNARRRPAGTADGRPGHRPTSWSTGPTRCISSDSASSKQTQVRFRDNEHLVRIIQRIAARVGRRIDETSPMVDARLPDGSRVNATLAAGHARRPDAVDSPLRPPPTAPRRPAAAGDVLAGHGHVPRASRSGCARTC